MLKTVFSFSVRLPYPKKVFLTALFWSLLSSGVLVGRAIAQYRFDVWTTEQGLPQNWVLDVLQTSDGFLWLTTFDGLVRYDGVRFKVFNTGNTPGLKGTRFVTLFEDKSGNLWITTEYSGITRYRDGRFTTFTADDGLPNNRAIAIEHDGAGGVVVGTQGGAAAKWQNGKFVPHQFSGRSFLDLPPEADHYRYIDSNGLYRIENGRAQLELPRERITADYLKRIFYPAKIWIVTDKGKTWQFRDGRLKPVRDDATASFIYALCENEDGSLLLGTENGGLLLFKDNKFTVYSTADGLPSNNIRAVYKDREGNVWLGTTKGLCRMRRQVITPYAKPEGLAADNTYPIYQDRQGDIWIGGWPGLTKYSQGKFTDYTARYQLTGWFITSLMEDRDGSLWIGNFNGGVKRIKDGQIITYNQPELFHDNPIHALYEDRAGSVWIGTHKRLIKYRDGAFSVYTTAEGLSGKIVNVICEDRRGSLWIGTEMGLTEYREGKFRAYSDRDGLSGFIVRAIYEDTDGVLWVGTYDGGLNRLKDGKFTRYTTREGLFNNGVFQILEDARGNFWMSCNLGVQRVRKQELNDFAEGRTNAIISAAYGRKEGMRDAECNGGGQPAGTRAQDGTLWFPTQEGVVVINPDAIPVSTQPPPVVVEEVIVNHEPISFGAGLELRPGQENFEISYTGLSFISPEQVRFKYKLDGLDNEWVDAGTRRTGYFSHVPAGAYTFRVIAANRDGVWNEQGAQLRVVISPPFWRQRWFVVLTVTLIGGLIWFISRRRLNALHDARSEQEVFSRRLLESQEAERKRIAAELHDSLAQNLLVIKNRALLTARLVTDHADAVGQLNEISEATDQAIDEVAEISYNLRPYQLDRLGLSKAVEAMVKKVATSSGIDFTARVAPLDGTFPPESEINLYRIVQESLNNVVKHSGASAAEVTISRSARAVRIEVRDNGHGFQTSAPRGSGAQRLSGAVRLSDAIGLTGGHRTGGRQISPKASGFGLTGIAERARMLGGRHEIQSVPGGGTSVIVEIVLSDRKQGRKHEQRNSHLDRRRPSAIS